MLNGVYKKFKIITKLAITVFANFRRLFQVH